jgi:hypothetical protein
MARALLSLTQNTHLTRESSSPSAAVVCGALVGSPCNQSVTNHVQHIAAALSYVRVRHHCAFYHRREVRGQVATAARSNSLLKISREMESERETNFPSYRRAVVATPPPRTVGVVSQVVAFASPPAAGGWRTYLHHFVGGRVSSGRIDTRVATRTAGSTEQASDLDSASLTLSIHNGRHYGYYPSLRCNLVSPRIYTHARTSMCMCAVGVTLPACREQTLGRCETQKAKEQPVLMPEICEISGADGRPGVLLMKLSAITPAFSAALDVIINFLVLT